MGYALDGSLQLDALLMYHARENAQYARVAGLTWLTWDVGESFALPHHRMLNMQCSHYAFSRGMIPRA